MAPYTPSTPFISLLTAIALPIVNGARPYVR